MQNENEIRVALDRLRQEYGEWTYDIPLPFDIWTKGNRQVPHTRLRRIVQIVSDLCRKPISQCRILDLACLDGIFSIEFAKQGAHTVGVEIREANIKKAIFCKDVLKLGNLEFRQDDVRNISIESYGRFDAIICSGILYHLPAIDAVNLIKTMYEMANRVVVIDTHVALNAVERFEHDGEEYWGSVYREHSDTATREEKATKLWASADNPTSFWFTRPSLVNLLSKTGFSSAYECFIPIHLGRSNVKSQIRNRCTFVAIREENCTIMTSPSVNAFRQNYPEQTLSYEPEAAALGMHEFRNRIASKIKKIFS